MVYLNVFLLSIQTARNTAMTAITVRVTDANDVALPHVRVIAACMNREHETLGSFEEYTDISGLIKFWRPLPDICENSKPFIIFMKITPRLRLTFFPRDKDSPFFSIQTYITTENLQSTGSIGGLNVTLSLDREARSYEIKLVDPDPFQINLEEILVHMGCFDEVLKNTDGSPYGNRLS